jgi:hypothetical protein
MYYVFFDLKNLDCFTIIFLSSLLSQVLRVTEDVISFRRWVYMSTSTPYLSDDKSIELQSSGEKSDSAAPSNSGKPNGRVNNDDQTLSEDPRLPSQITPTPSRDVLPRELPLKVFDAKSSKDGAATDVVPTTAASNSKDTDNMSGVSSATSSESSATHTDTVGRQSAAKKWRKYPRY